MLREAGMIQPVELPFYRYFIGQGEIQCSERPTDSVTIVTMDIPTPDRGDEADTTSMMGQRGRRKDGPMVKARWQLFCRSHEPMSKLFEIETPNEISLGQLVAEYVGPYFQRRINSQSRYRWKGGKQPGQLPEGFDFRISGRIGHGLSQIWGYRIAYSGEEEFNGQATE
jgi:hypothetical protein